MIIEGVRLNTRRLFKSTFIAAGGSAAIDADPRRRAIRLTLTAPNPTAQLMFTGTVKGTIVVGGQQLDLNVMEVNSHHPVDDLSVELHGELVTQAFKFVDESPVPSQAAFCWEFFEG